MSDGDLVLVHGRTIRGVGSAVFGDYGRRLRFLVVANVSLMVLLPGAVGLLGEEDWPPVYCSVVGTMALMVWTGLVSGHLKLVLARHQARLLPGYPRAQVLAGASLVAPVLALSAFFHWMAGLDVLAAAAVALFVASLYWAGPYLFTQGHQLLLLVPPLVLVLGRPEIHEWWQSVGPGWSGPTWSVVGIAISVALTGIVVHRMLHLNESSPEYGRDPSIGWRPGRPIDQDIPFSSLFNRLVPWFGRYRLSGLDSRFGAGFAARVQLWRRGMSRASPMVTGLSLAGMVALVGSLFTRHPESSPGTQAGILGIYLMFFALVRAAYVHRRRERLSYEALYPVARERMLRELGGATVADVVVTWVFLWLGTLIARGLGLFPDVAWTILLGYAGYSLGATLLGCGLIPWVAQVRGNSAFLLVLYLATLAVGLPVAMVLVTGPGLESAASWTLGGAALAILGSLVGYAGYRHWCELELGRTDLGSR